KIRTQTPEKGKQHNSTIQAPYRPVQPAPDKQHALRKNATSSTQGDTKPLYQIPKAGERHDAVGDAEQRKSASQNVNSAPPSKNRILEAHPMKVVSGSKFVWHGAVGDAEQRKSASQNVNSAPPSKVRSRRSGNQKPFSSFVSASTEFRREYVLHMQSLPQIAAYIYSPFLPFQNRILEAHPMKVVSGSIFGWHDAVGDAEQRKSASQNVNSAPPSKVRSRRSGKQKPFFKFRFGSTEFRREYVLHMQSLPQIAAYIYLLFCPFRTESSKLIL
ncbi:hypothetical protein COOONC_05946, partial [Cooperia oncophora]